MFGNAVIVAIDHGLHWGVYDDFADPEEMIENVLASGADGVLAGVPFLRRFADLLASYPDVTVIATLDQLHDSTIPGEHGSAEIHQQVFSVEAAAAVGADAAKVALVYGRQNPDVLAENIRFTAQAAERGREAGVPLVVEPTLWGQRIDGDLDGDLLADANRLAFELGADILKSPYPGRDAFAPITANAPVPLYIAGGPAVDTAEGLLEMVADASTAGADGVMFGRNVWQHENPAGVVQALQAIVHDGASPAEAKDLL